MTHEPKAILRVFWNVRRDGIIPVSMRPHRFVKFETFSCEIEDFVELIFASCVGYFDRAYYGIYVTSSRMLVLMEGNKI